MIGKRRPLKGVRFSSRGSSTGSNTLGSAATDSQSTGDETPTQSVEEVPASPTVVEANQYGQPIGRKRPNWLNFSIQLQGLKKFDLQGKVKDSDILSHVGKLRKEFKSTLKTRYYKEMSEKEGREPSHLEQFRFQHLRKDGSGKLSSEAAEQVYVRNKWDEACKMVKDSMPIPESSSAPQDNIALENEVYTQVFGPDKDGKMLGYGRGMTKSRLFGYGSVTRESQSTSAITTLIEEMSAKHVQQIQTFKPNKQFERKLYSRKQNLDSYGGYRARSSFDS
ncbi:hypothetical protein CXB51_025477 [Gossypium anomalum]|uniref:Uncharacterized protein n=1 Tax=Gossypium anomalum TaxID=47600 RepID=A0A8J5YGV2_9ROSI|nr:hypothetical protein CXB51_025477 [Gossypium anomalum]